MKTKKHRGLAPSREEVALRRSEGYLTPAAAAAKYGVSGKLMYKWRNLWAPAGSEPVMFGGLPGAKRVGANVWLLEAAIRDTLRARGQLPAARRSV